MKVLDVTNSEIDFTSLNIVVCFYNRLDDNSEILGIDIRYKNGFPDLVEVEVSTEIE